MLIPSQNSISYEFGAQISAARPDSDRIGVKMCSIMQIEIAHRTVWPQAEGDGVKAVVKVGKKMAKCAFFEQGPNSFYWNEREKPVPDGFDGAMETPGEP